MNIEDEISARIQAAKVWDMNAQLGNFQLKATEDGYVLTDLKTSHAQLINFECHELRDLEMLFPGTISRKH
ncbi:MAG TPA: hypothetical protein VMO78_08040 [Rhizomicrobium sp.]|nr:hypothetical protein [Rhizomicrobium sp.]